MTATTRATAHGRRLVRRTIWRVRCESRPVSRYVFNLGPVWRYHGSGGLVGAAGDVAQTLRADGVATCPAADLVGEDLIAEVVARCEDIVSAAELVGTSQTSMKGFLHQLLGREPEIDPSDPLVRLAMHPQIQGVAEAYSGMRLRLQDLNVWLTSPTEEAPQQSQRWHRDLPEDHDIVKCFVYVRDVPAGAGPLSYVVGSNAAAVRRERLRSTFDGIGYRLNDEVVAGLVGPRRVVVAEGLKGAVTFADTRGVHRGGYARTHERLVVQITWASNATTRERALRPASGVRRRDLSGVRLARVQRASVPKRTTSEVSEVR